MSTLVINRMLFVIDLIATLIFPLMAPQLLGILATVIIAYRRGLPRSHEELTDSLSIPAMTEAGIYLFISAIIAHIAIAYGCRFGCGYRPLWSRIVGRSKN